MGGDEGVSRGKFPFVRFRRSPEGSEDRMRVGRKEEVGKASGDYTYLSITFMWIRNYQVCSLYRYGLSPHPCRSPEISNKFAPQITFNSNKAKLFHGIVTYLYVQTKNDI